MRRCLLVAGLWAVLACRPDGRVASGTTVDTTGPFPVLTSTGEPPVWTAESLFVVGTGSNPGVELGSVRSVLLGPGHRLMVVDPSYQALLEFDSTGAFVRKWGRDGSGPGEYLTPYSVAWLHDTLALLDPGNSRLGRYDPAGGWLGSWPVQRITGGQFIRLYRTPPTVWAYAFRPGARGTEGLFVRYISTGPVDTLVVLRQAPGVAAARTCKTADGGLSFFSSPFGATLIAMPSADGAQVVALTSNYRIATLSPAGDTLRLLRRTLPPAPVTDTEWQDANADWLAFRARWPAAECDRGEFDRPATKPLIVSMFHDDVNRLWIELVTADGSRYEVFDLEGRLIAKVAGLPPTGGIEPGVAGDRIAIAGSDAGDVPAVRIFRLRR